MNSTRANAAGRSGPVALITGGGRGIGRALALRLAREGARVVLAARSRGQLDAVVAEIQAAGGTALAAPCDVTAQADVARTVALASEHFGPVTLLINNAGSSGALGPIGIVDPLAWWNTQSVHVLGALLCMSAVIPGMTGAGGGASSASPRRPVPSSRRTVPRTASPLIRSPSMSMPVAARGHPRLPIQPGTITTQMARETLADPAAEKWAAPLVAAAQCHAGGQRPGRGVAAAARRRDGQWSLGCARRSLPRRRLGLRGCSARPPPVPEPVAR
jgi:NAD(P)-dependent dehydrogenase (short-subunit alcohol dehydrogenase family)